MSCPGWQAGWHTASGDVRRPGGGRTHAAGTPRASTCNPQSPASHPHAEVLASEWVCARMCTCTSSGWREGPQATCLSVGVLPVICNGGRRVSTRVDAALPASPNSQLCPPWTPAESTCSKTPQAPPLPPPASRLVPSPHASAWRSTAMCVLATRAVHPRRGIPLGQPLSAGAADRAEEGLQCRRHDPSGMMCGCAAPVRGHTPGCGLPLDLPLDNSLLTAAPWGRPLT